ncbi:MAG: thioredoxin family protein [Thermogemmata sp.]|nr:thioredoxin family protein [Thermogemmata sp.]
MNLFDKFGLALPLPEYLQKYGSDSDRQKWQRMAEMIRLNDQQQQLLRTFRRQMNVLVLAGAWCGDCVNQCPIFERFAEVTPVIVTRYLDRDAHPEVQDALMINGGRRVPVVVFFSEDGYEVARYGDRTLSRYRQLAAELGGPGCPTGLVGSDDTVLPLVVQDWLNEFERVQWILRLSARLRQKHGD